MKKTKLIITTILLGIFFVVGCDKDFEELNTNPNDAISVPSSLLSADILRNAGNYLYSTFVGGDMGSCWGQHWAKVNYEEEARYKPRNSVLEDFCWKGMYEDVVSDAYSMQQLGIEEENAYTQGVGLIMQAYGYSVLTDMFGMIPFTEAMKSAEGVFSPKYDEQSVVYDGILAMLDEANTLLTTGTGSLNGDTDLLYAGDAALWAKFANSLKFRCLMRISEKRAGVATELQDIVSNRSIFASNAEEAGMVYLDADPNANPIYESLDYGARYEYKINSVLVDMLVTLGDPRLEVYCEPNSDGEYRGKPSGIDQVPNDDYNYDNVSAVGAFYIDPNLPATFMSYSQLMFLMAEAANKGYISGDAATYYNNAVKANFDFNGLTDSYAAYIAANAYDGTLQQIAEQEWIALYCQGVETWTEWRRTKYPALEPAIEAVVSEIPSRYSYPAIEQSINATNYNAAVAKQGADILTTPIWWLQ